MKTTLLALKEQFFSELETLESPDDLVDLKYQFLGKKGALTQALKGLKDVSPEERPAIGQLANEIKDDLQSKIDEKETAIQDRALSDSLKKGVDVSAPGFFEGIGSAHPISQVIDDVVDIFSRFGFSAKEGPEIELEKHNFDDLNIPADHPARDMHDTFYIDSSTVLRTHTSPVQIRTMLNQAPPLRMLAPGKVYRCDSDTSHSPVFHQVEGLLVDNSATFAELKGILTFFLQSYFGKSKKVRFRPSYFPFTEPSAEVDVECVVCSGKGCGLCKQTGWLEILGAGMVNRQVFRSAELDPDVWRGFAFGLGIERIAMLKYHISDIRMFYENDLRFLSQF